MKMMKRSSSRISNILDCNSIAMMEYLYKVTTIAIKIIVILQSPLQKLILAMVG